MFARFVRRPLWQIVLGMLLPIAIWDVTGSFGELRLLAAPSETRWIAPLSTDNELKTIGSTTFAPVVQKVMPSVVSIYSSRQTTSDTRNQEWLNDPLFRRFLGDQWLGGQTLLPRERQTRSMGSGVIISPDGYIATNHHVVEASTDIKVLLSDRREFAARLIGTDSKTDLAVLKIEHFRSFSCVCYLEDKLRTLICLQVEVLITLARKRAHCATETVRQICQSGGIFESKIRQLVLDA